MEQVGAVFVHLDTGFGLGLRISVPADVRPALDHQNPLVELGRRALGDGETEEPGSDDDQIKG